MALPRSAAILVVDDQQMSIAVTQAMLASLGYTNVDTATNAADAFDYIRTRRYELIFSDWHMQPVNGPALFQQVKQAAGFKRPKFYFLTGDPGWGCMVSARDMGADGIVIKPQRPRDLMSKISETLNMQ